MKIKKLHSWNVSPKEAIQIQHELKGKVNTVAFRKKIRFVAGADCSVSVKDNLIKAAVAVLTFPELELFEYKTSTRRLAFPYVPGLLSFREGPALLDCFEKLDNRPDLIIFDGQGLAHPRRMGIATHMGILLGLPSIGCGKSPLYGNYDSPGEPKGSFTDIRDRDGDLIGACLRTRSSVKPVFISIGSNINLNGAIDIVLRCLTKYRLPEPIRRSHELAKITVKRSGEKGKLTKAG